MHHRKRQKDLPAPKQKGRVMKSIANIKNRIEKAAQAAGRSPDSVTLVAVSKRVEAERLKQAFEAGQTVFGENYLQEAQHKVQTLPTEISWHFIGHLQSNKTKTVAQLFETVQTLDRMKLAKSLNKHLEPLGKVMQVYVQVNIGQEEQKGGVPLASTLDFVGQVLEFPRLEFKGLMAMPPWNADPEESRPYFKQLRQLRDQLWEEGVVPMDQPIGLSMGMSNDFEVAIEEGATLVRVGTALFGERG